MDMGTKRRSTALLLAGTAWLPVVTFAQPADEPEPEIVVTALLESEPLATTGAPVSVIDGRAAREWAVTTAERTAEFSTALTVLPNATANVIFLRGVGNFTLTPATDPAVGWNYDGVFVARSNATQGQFFDLARVEVLKGPQGVLYGRNATAGTINLVPRLPEAGVIEGYASASYGSRGTLNLEGAVNLPLGENGALRVSGQALDQDQYLTGFAGGPSQQSLRMQVMAELQPGLSVRVASDFMRQRGVPLGTTYLGYYLFDAAAARYRFVPSSLPLDTGNRDPLAQAFRQTVPLTALGRTLNSQDSVPYQNNEFYGAHAEIVADLGAATLTVLPAWRRNQFDQVLAGSPFGYLYQEHDDQRSLEARLNGKAGPVEWLVGGMLFDEDIRARYGNNFASSLTNSDTRYHPRGRAIFGNATVTVAPGLRLLGGIRQSWDRKTVDGEATTWSVTCNTIVAGRRSCPLVPLLQLGATPATAGLPVPAVGAPLPILVNGVNTGATIARADRVDPERVARFSVTTWRAGAELDIGAAGLLYANVQTGYRPGGLNTAVGFETYAPEKVTAYTLGARWRSPDRAVSLHGEAFWWDYRDQQVSSVQPDLSTPPRNVNFTRNIARSRIRGIAVEADVRPARGTRLTADMQYLDARYRDFTYLQASAGAPPLTDCSASLTSTANLYAVDCSGQRPFASPKWTMNLGAAQTVPLGGADLTVMARTRFVSAQNIGSALLPEQVIPAHWTADAQARIDLADGRFEIAAFVNNLTNRRYPTFVIYHPTSNLVVSTVASPRIIGVRGGVKF